MKLLKCRNGAMLVYEADTETYWVIVAAFNRPIKIFAGATAECAIGNFDNYAKGADDER